MPTVVYKPHEIVVVPFPFTDSAATKRRPAVVVSKPEFQKSNGSVVLGMITSAKHSHWFGDVKLRDWKTSGLPHASIMRVKLFTLDERFILRVLGNLSDRDIRSVNDSLTKVIAV